MDAPKLRSWCLAVGVLLSAGRLVPEPSAAAPFVRREIHKLSAPQVDAYRKGVALMMSRPQTDPTSWLY